MTRWRGGHSGGCGASTTGTGASRKARGGPRSKPGREASLARWESLKERWDRQVDRAEKERVHVIYTDGYGTLRREMSSAAGDDPYLAEGVRSEIDRVIRLLDTPEEIRGHVEKHRDAVLAWLERRDDMLGYVSAWDMRPAPDARRYDAWRDSVDQAAAEAEIVLDNRRLYGIHLDGLKHRGEGLGSALSRVREVLAEGRPAHGGDPGARAQGR